MMNRISSLTLVGISLLTGCAFLPTSTIQKQVNVTEKVRGKYVDTDTSVMSAKCFESSISKGQLNELLSKGVKVITSEEFSEPMKYSDGTYSDLKGNCIGKTYILEGSKSLLNEL